VATQIAEPVPEQVWTIPAAWSPSALTEMYQEPGCPSAAWGTGPSELQWAIFAADNGLTALLGHLEVVLARKVVRPSYAALT